MGLRATWNWTLTPAQAAWVATAELTGIGKHGTAGMGVVRCAK
jgi:CRISPR/Cas system endoribonuclease Cas6 (RAMP superfamily)